jgi:hypothetical protein
MNSKQTNDRFVRSENVRRFENLLKTETDEAKRITLSELLADERKKQKDAGDRSDL